MIRIVALLLLEFSFSGSAHGYVPKPTEFPPIDQGVYLSGELVVVDPINRRGGIRLDCKSDEKLAQNGPLHYFAMLPCGEVWLHGAPAPLRDVPPGTHVQGYFFLPPAGEEKTITPEADFADLIPKQNHAVLLEDDLSYYLRQGQSWKAVSVDFATSKLTVESAGKTVKDGLSGRQTLDFSIATRVWKGGRPAEMKDVMPGAPLWINFGRAVNWRDHEFGASDIWLDEVSWKQAAELQRRATVHYHRLRWLPARIDAVESHDFGGGLVTISIYGGIPKQLIDEIEADKNERLAVAAAEPTLRTWTHRSDRTFGRIVKWESAPPVPGFSGVRLQVKFAELLDHFRPGNAVRIKAENWLWISNTPEERVRNFDDRERSRTLRLPQQATSQP